MSYFNRSLFVGLVCLALLAVAPVFATPISVQQHSAGSVHYRGNLTNTYHPVFYNDLTLDTNGDVVVDSSVNTFFHTMTARTVINVSSDATGATFRYDFEHAIGGGVEILDYVESYVSPLKFTALIDTTYAISGSYASVSESSTKFYSKVYLRDLTGGSLLFLDSQLSSSTANEVFQWGDATGGEVNEFSGSATGQLIAGRQYEFYFDNYMQDLYASNPSSARGFALLQIGQQQAVPEPKTLALCSIGLLAAFSQRVNASSRRM